MGRIFKLSMLKMTIFQRLLIGIIAIVMINTLIAIIGIMSVNRLESNSKVILEEAKKRNAIQELKLNFLQLNMPGNDYLIHGNKVEIINYERFDSIVKSQIIKCKKDIGVHFNRSFIDELERSFNEVRVLTMEIFEMKNPIGNPEGAIIMENLDAITVNVVNDFDELLKIKSLEMDKYLTTNQATNIKATRVLIIGGLVISVSLFFGGFFYVQEITHPIKNLSKMAKEISLGDLSIKADVGTRTQDEIDHFSKLFNDMIGILEKTTVPRAYFNNILKRMAETLIITDLAGKIKIVNQSTIDLLEYTEEELIGLPIEKVLSGQSGSKVLNTYDIDKLLKEESVQNIYNTYYTKSDKLIPVCFSRSIIYDKKNNMKGILHIAFHNTVEVKEEQHPIEENLENEFKNIKTIGDIPLTNRELEIMKLITKELSNREIADKLFISVRTVETHRKNIMQKLNTKSVISLVRYAAQNGII